MTAILQVSGPNIEVMTNLMDVDEKKSSSLQELPRFYSGISGTNHGTARLPGR